MKRFHDIRPKLEGSTLFDENTARMYSGVASKKAETRAIDHTLRAYQLTVAPQNVHDEIVVVRDNSVSPFQNCRPNVVLQFNCRLKKQEHCITI